jgi:UDP-N-acetylglucosamine 2-epimerase (non-hydrolysing)
LKVLLGFGTRPEAIKLAPVIAELRRRPGFDVTVALTAQHRELLDQVLAMFHIEPDVDLALMQPSQSLAGLTSRVMLAMDALLAERQPDVTIVQGDTTSAFVTALASFYRGIPVLHVEAGLRTPAALNPFPEEINRRLTSSLAFLHCAPTARAQQALLDGGVGSGSIVVTGNTIVDALHSIQRNPAFAAAPLPSGVDLSARIVLVTVHRRENWIHLPDVCDAIRQVVERRPEVQVVLPVHPNPIVQQTLHRELGGVAGVVLLPALDYLSFLKVMSHSWIVLTDSGGVQEEAPVLGRPVLVMRDATERPEAIELGVARLVGTHRDAIVDAVISLLSDDRARNDMAREVSPFGDGHAAARIADLLEQQRPSIAAFANQACNPRAVRTAEEAKPA